MPLPSFTVTELFVPLPSGVSNAGVVLAPPTTPTFTFPFTSWLQGEYAAATIVQLPTTSFQPGAPERTILAIAAVMFSQEDALYSQMAQGAFLSSAATGTVTYQTLQSSQLVTVTIQVTPDPSIPSQNPTGAPGWLDVLGQSVYDVERLQASYATGNLALVNLGSSTVTASQGAYHVANANGATYSNATAALSVPVSPTVGTNVTAVGVGGSSTTITMASAHGLSVGQSVYLNIPTASGIAGLAGVFALVTSAGSTAFSVGVGSSGTYTGTAGLVYTCTLALMTADVIGTGSAAAPGTVTVAITQNAGVYCSNLVPWSAANWEGNLDYATRCQLSLAAASPNGPSQAYVYFALSAAQILADEVPAYQFSNGPIIDANSFSNPQTGIVTTVVASTTPNSVVSGAAVTPGFAQNPVTGATNENPCVVTVANAIASWTGTSGVIIDRVLGIAGVNGSFNATYLTANTFSIPVNTTAGGAYTGGGSVEGGDLGAVDNLLQDSVVPDGILAVTVSALALPITVVATVTVPVANVAQYTLAAPSALSTYLGSLPLGGVYPGGETVTVSYDEIVAALIGAGVIALGQATYVRGTPSVTVNGGTTDVTFPSNQYQALLATPTITVVGV